MTLSELHKSDPHLYLTDKGDDGHSFSGCSYLDRYGFHFESIRNAPGDILEIGVSFGGSIRLWRDFFEFGIVFGLDIRNLIEFQVSDGRIIIDRGDQSNVGHLKSLCKRSAGFKLIVDDGSHMAEHILISLEHLWPSVLPGGWYVMEDLRLPLDWGTHHLLESKFLEIQRRIDRMVGDVQALIHYPMVTLIQKTA